MLFIRASRVAFRLYRELSKLFRRDHAASRQQVRYMGRFTIHKAAAKALPNTYVPEQEIERGRVDDLYFPSFAITPEPDLMLSDFRECSTRCAVLE